MRKLFSLFVLASLLGACTRNIGPLPEPTPEYTELYFSGTVTGDPTLPSRGVLYVAASPASDGSTHVVGRYEVNGWPVKFILSDLNKMDQNTKVQGGQTLFARFDQDGDIATKQPGDQEYRSSVPVALGTKNVAITLLPIEGLKAKLDIHGVIKGNLSTVGKVMFIFARGANRPMPVAAARLSVSSLPVEFHLGDANILMPNLPLPEELQIVVRVDADGDPMTRSKGDIEVTSKLGPAVRKDPVEIVLGTP